MKTDLAIMNLADFARKDQPAKPVVPSKQRKAEIAKRRNALTDLDEDIDKVMGRVLRYAKRLSDLRTKRKRLIRELAKSLAMSA